MVNTDHRLATAAALRDLSHAFVAHDRDDDGLRELERLARDQAAKMRSGRARDRIEMSRAAQETPDAQLDSGFEDRAVAGRANPTALVVEIDFRHDEVAASVTFGPACGGPPGRAHGGVVCGVFDDVTGFAVNHFVRELAFTGELTVRYVAPVPLDTRLQISARLDRREGRKLYLTEELTADGAVLARCTATCITAAPA